MSEHLIAEVLAVVSIVLFFALLFKAQECTHWKHSYESLRNGMLAEGRSDSRRIISDLQDMQTRAMTFDEMIDSQG